MDHHPIIQVLDALGTVLQVVLQPCALTLASQPPLPATIQFVQADVQAGQQLLERWGTRNEAIAQLEAVVEGVSGPVASQTSPTRGQEGVFGHSYLCYHCRGSAKHKTPLMSKIHEFILSTG